MVNEENKGICPCDFGICDEEGGCPKDVHIKCEKERLYSLNNKYKLEED